MSIAFIVLCYVMVNGCSTDQGNTRQGAILGALAGAVIGSQAGGEDRERNALIGALVGAGIGAAIGNYLDRKEKELKETFGSKVKVERLGNNALLATFSDSVPFDTGSATLKSEAYPVLNRLADILRDNTGARLVVTGHTDNVGNHSANQKLSEKRAEAVAKFLAMASGMNPEMIALRGAGEMAPVASNDTAEGRAKNRRVDILILPMKDPVPPVRFTVKIDTEPAGRANNPVQYMSFPDMLPSPKVPLGDRQGRKIRVAGGSKKHQRVLVEEAIRENPHLYSPIRTVDELLKS